MSFFLIQYHKIYDKNILDILLHIKGSQYPLHQQKVFKQLKVLIK
jgi:hypothetical protein